MAHPVSKNVCRAEAIITSKSVDFMKVVEWFESGAENVYLVDDIGRYLWRAA